MLYISRYFGLRDIGVVDTDDGVEDIIRPSQLNEISNLGIEIHGFYQNPFVVAPYQVPERETSAQVKLRLLSHVSTVVYNGIISSILWEEDEVKIPVVLRLSDYGTEIGDFVLRHNVISRTHKITLIFDDKLKNVSLLSFTPMTVIGKPLGRNGLGVVFDLHEVTNDDLALSVYRSLANHEPGLSGLRTFELFDSVIDSSKRWNEFTRRFT